MSDTRAEIDRSIDATRAVLSKLTPEQFEQVRADANAELLRFIHEEWLPDAHRRRLAAEAFHEKVRVHHFDGRAA